MTIAVPATRASWAPDGVALCTPANWQGYPAIVADGTGGGFVTWSNERSGAVSIYAQRIGGDGSTLWGEEGAAVCTAPYAQYNAELAVDGVGGAIIVWHDIRSLNLDIYAQRVDAAGEAKWAADGVAICTAAGDQTDPLIVSDDSGGAIIAWVDGRSGSLDIYAQRIDAAGVAQWAPGGVAVCGGARGAEVVVFDSGWCGRRYSCLARSAHWDSPRILSALGRNGGGALGC
ncbi:MAG: hypothetical protein IPO18_04675 [bacterium]|nr:hypothetical protein [bacterium]